MQDMHVDLESMGECAVLLRIGDRIDPHVNACVHALCAALRKEAIPGLQDIVPAYASVLLRFDPEQATAACEWHDHLQAIARRVLEGSDPDASLDARPVHRIPVCYEDRYAPDMAQVERETGLNRAQIIERHVRPEYRVAMIGFAPGFAYLLGLDPRLHVARRDRPRTRVPAGSVALGGAQTGVYPSELPGGWQLIGRSPRTLFDAHDTERPCLLAPGDRVRFEAIGTDAFEQMLKDGPA